MRVGNGEDIRVWEDPWIPRAAFFSCVKHHGAVDENLHVSDIITEDRCWNTEMVRELCADEDAELILTIPLAAHPLPDHLV